MNKFVGEKWSISELAKELRMFGILGKYIANLGIYVCTWKTAHSEDGQ